MTEISGVDLLDEVAGFIRRFVRPAESQISAITLWVLHAHTLDAVAFTSYISVTSAEKQSGKSTLCEVLVLLVPKPWYTGRVTAAVLTRKVNAEKPTLLFDESDAAFNGNKEYAEALRGILDLGFTQNGTASCCVGHGANTAYKDFKTFCPKLIAGIGRLPDTVADRSIPIRLQRATPEGRKMLEKFQQRTAKLEGDALRKRIEQWAPQSIKALKVAPTRMP